MTVFINFIVINIFGIFLVLTPAYTMGQTFKKFFDNKIENAEKRRMELDEGEDIKTVVKRLRYRSTGGVWKFLFTILTLPAKLLGFFLRKAADGITITFGYLVMDSRFVHRLPYVIQKVLAIFFFGLNRSAIYAAFLGFILFITNIASQLTDEIAIAKTEGLAYLLEEGLISLDLLVFAIILLLPKIIELIQSILYCGMLGSEMEDIGFFDNIAEELDNLGENIYTANGEKLSVYSFICGVVQEILSTIGDFLRNIKIWCVFTLSFEWLAAFLPVTFIIALILTNRGTPINIFEFIANELGLFDVLKEFARTWGLLYILKFVFMDTPLKILSVTHPKLYCGILKKTEKVSIRFNGFSENIDSKFNTNSSSRKTWEWSKRKETQSPPPPSTPRQQHTNNNKEQEAPSNLDPLKNFHDLSGRAKNDSDK